MRKPFSDVIAIIKQSTKAAHRATAAESYTCRIPSTFHFNYFLIVIQLQMKRKLVFVAGWTPNCEEERGFESRRSSRPLSLSNYRDSSSHHALWPIQSQRWLNRLRGSYVSLKWATCPQMCSASRANARKVSMVLVRAVTPESLAYAVRRTRLRWNGSGSWRATRCAVRLMGFQNHDSNVQQNQGDGVMITTSEVFGNPSRSCMVWIWDWVCGEHLQHASTLRNRAFLNTGCTIARVWGFQSKPCDSTQ